MTRRNWIAACAASAALLTAAGIACGPEFFPEDASLFDPVAGVPARASDLLYDPTSQWFGHVGDWGDAFRGQNLSEWRDWLRVDSSGAAEWDSVLNSPSRARLDSALRHALGKGPLPEAWSAFALFKDIPAAKLAPALRYAAFAAEVEPFSRRSEEDSWASSRKLPKLRSPDTLRAEGLAAARAATEPFLRQRWFFQVAKLSFYTRPDTALALLDGLRGELSGPSASLFWRSRMYRAGLLADPAAHNLECARVIWGYPLLAPMAAKDFILPQKDGDWKRALALAQGRDDRLALWFAMGLRSDALEALGHMLAEDSAAPMAEILAARAVAQAEWTHTSCRPLEELALGLCKSQRTAAPAFWNLLAGHLAGLSGKPGAEALLETASQLAKGDTLILWQVRRSRVLARLCASTSPSPALEDFLRTELPVIDSHAGTHWAAFDGAVRERLGKVWSGKDPALRACLIGHIPSDPDSLTALHAFWTRPGTSFEEFAKRRSGFSDSGLRQNLGAALLLRDRIPEAVQTLSVGPSELLGTDPFQAEIRDDHDRDHARYAKAPWTRATFARELLRLDALAAQSGTEGAKAALREGIGLYNQTYFGNARSVYLGTVLEMHDDPARRNVAPARKRFEQAARDLPTAEGRAWATWLVAKCERDVRIARGDSLNVPGQSYARLRSRYAKTPFWKRALKECGWLSSWARR